MPVTVPESAVALLDDRVRKSPRSPAAPLPTYNGLGWHLVKPLLLQQLHHSNSIGPLGSPSSTRTPTFDRSVRAPLRLHRGYPRRPPRVWRRRGCCARVDHGPYPADAGRPPPASAALAEGTHSNLSLAVLPARPLTRSPPMPFSRRRQHRHLPRQPPNGLFGVVRSFVPCPSVPFRSLRPSVCSERFVPLARPLPRSLPTRPCAPCPPWPAWRPPPFPRAATRRSEASTTRCWPESRPAPARRGRVCGRVCGRVPGTCLRKLIFSRRGRAMRTLCKQRRLHARVVALTADSDTGSRVATECVSIQ